MRFSGVAIGATLVVGSVALLGCGKEHSEGSAQKATGHMESAAGSLIGDDKLKREGKKDEVVGGVKGAIGDVKDAVHDAAK